jgi:5'-3' exonuclease
MSKGKITLIDGTSLIYSACYNSSIKEDATDDFSTYKEALEYYIQTILEETKADYYLIFGDDHSSFRKRLFKSYKADRTRPHMKFKAELSHYAYEELGFIKHEDLEADDLCLLSKNILINTYAIDKDDIIIASKDSDIPQDEMIIFNYGWKAPLYKKYKDAPIPLEELEKGLKNAFRVVSKEEAEFNLWKQVLIKGHNNKLDYLEGCGDKTAEAYLTGFKPLANFKPYEYVVLSAFINGIKIDKDSGIKRNVDSYGLYKGIEKFANAFKQTYLLRNKSDLEQMGIQFEFPTLTKTY